MPVGYVIGTAFVAGCTLFALAPLRRPMPLSTLSYYFGLVLNELPFVAFYGLLASTLLAFSQGDLDSTGGWAALGLAILTAAGLGVVVWRGSRARRATDRALSEGLGDGWRAAIDAGLGTRLRRRLPWTWILFGPWLVDRGRVKRVPNISYGDAGKRNLLDVYRHRSQPSGGPVLMHLHGGRFRSGRKNREARPLLYRLASQGWVCISANYRLTPHARFPDYHVDIKKVIAWAREHGHEHGADPATLFVAGSSAGAHIAALAALTPGDPRFQPGFERADTSVTAAICLYGYYGSLNNDEQFPSSPAGYVGRDAPPFFLTHGDRDTVVPVERARAFVAQLRRTSSNPVVYAELPGAQHSFDLFHSIRFETVIDAIEGFASWVRSRPETHPQ